jgi:hypothetical protein
MLRSFPKRDCGIQDFWKTGLNVQLPYLGFPRLPQAAQKGLCKAEALCEKRVQSRDWQGVERALSSTGDEASTTSTSEPECVDYAVRNSSHSRGAAPCLPIDPASKDVRPVPRPSAFFMAQGREPFDTI